MPEFVHKQLMLGEKFPEITVYTTQGKMDLPEYFNGSYFVLFSHPADFTPVCTTEFIAFQQRIKEFEQLNCKLVGLSVDQVFSHIKWLEWINENVGVDITFPVIAATETLANQLGIIHPGKGLSTIRATFICDTEGIVRVILYYPPELGRNIDEILRAVKAIQVADENEVAMPADWPNNELIKDKVIVPPPKNVKSSKETVEGTEGYDWWFKYKNLH